MNEGFQSTMCELWRRIRKYLYKDVINEITEAFSNNDEEQILKILQTSRNEQIFRFALCYSVSSNNISVLRSILDEIKSKDIGGTLYDRKQCNVDESPMHTACKFGRDEALLLLIHSGFLINIVDKFSRTPLWVSVAENRDATTALLLSKDTIDVNISTTNSLPYFRLHTTLETYQILHACNLEGVAVGQDMLNYLEHLIDRNITVLMKATRMKNTASTVGICGHYPDPNTTDGQRRIPLHYACQFGNLESVKVLISCGSDVNARDANRLTPLYAACKNGHSNIATLLLDSGAHINCKEEDAIRIKYSSKYTPKTECYKVVNYSKIPLMAAINNRHTETVKILLSRNVDIHIQSSNSTTPLHVACSKGTLGMVKELVDNGGDINSLDSFGQTSLLFSMRSGIYNIGLKVYLTNVNNNEVDQDNNLLLDDVEEGNKIFRFLIEKGAIINCKDSHGLSPIDHAITTDRIFPTFILLKYGAKIQWNYSRFHRIIESQKHHTSHTGLFKILFKINPEIRKFLSYESKDILEGLLGAQCLSLKDLCRIKIRNSVTSDTGIGYVKKLNALGLPKLLISFLMFEDMEQYIHLRDRYTF